MGDKMPLENVLQVGVCYPEWKTMQDGFRMEWGEAGLVLYAMLNGVKDIERSQFAPEKKLTVRYTIIEDVCYFAFQFGDMPWADCPFSPTLYRSVGQTVDFPKLADTEGLALTVLLIDTKTGELCSIRLIGLGHDFSTLWLEWAEDALERELTFEEYNKRVDDAYMTYASIDLALKAAGEGNGYIVEGI